MLTVLLTGLLTTMALIVAIGPQAAWLLRQGLRRDRVALAATCCLIGDVLLIIAGTAGVGALLDYAPWLLDAIRWIGVAYLTWFAYRSFRSAFKVKEVNLEKEAETAETLHVAMTSSIPVVPKEGEGPTTTTTRQKVQVTSVSKISTVAATGLTLSILNPHAWVDSLVVLGTMANSFGPDKWWFAGGAVLASVIWLTLLSGGSAALAKLLNKPRTWQIIDVVVGITMLVVAGFLAISGF
ncbi:LysE family transporter [Nesterenkonia sp. MY13]|uniref:LysE family transporter n=1 Tax=Nesterenkonia sedimenti TaxID=1463632 RepID=A0A7X8TLE6_9MICC|nr:LysE family transporter [Nesterenkonia sedimenti]NLS10726.1 LysE family transporter [Nesterenkonia sedimenti]